jgi:hypothetical protein
MMKLHLLAAGLLGQEPAVVRRHLPDRRRLQLGVRDAAQDHRRLARQGGEGGAGVGVSAQPW